jgi:type I restriction enzyme, R subunit
MLQSLFIERMEQNEDIFGKFMNEKEFQNVVSKWISEKVYNRLREELSEKNTGQVTE